MGREPPFARLVAFRSVANADARGGRELRLIVIRLDPKAVGHYEVFAIERTVDVQKFRKPSRTFRPFNAAYQHGFGTLRRPRHNIQHFVHSVAKVDVCAAAGRIHYIRSRRSPLVGMAGGVLFAAVGFRFRYAPPYCGSVLQPAAEPRADKRLRHRHRIPPIVLFHQSFQIVLLTFYLR